MEVIDVSNRPDLQQFADEFSRSKKPIVFRNADRELGIFTPAPVRPKRLPRGKAVALDDPLFELIGIGEGREPGGISGKKHEYLAKAYREHHTSGQ